MDTMTWKMGVMMGLMTSREYISSLSMASLVVVDAVFGFDVHLEFAKLSTNLS